MTSRVRQNFAAASEEGINKQINLELYASYVYLSMASYFQREDVALPGFHKFFSKMSEEEREHAQKLMHYQNQRGGRVILRDISVSLNFDQFIHLLFFIWPSFLKCFVVMEIILDFLNFFFPHLSKLI